MLRWLRLGIQVATLLVALGILMMAVLVFVVVPRPAAQEWLGEKLSEAAGPAVAFEAVSLAFWPEPGIRLHSVSLGAEERVAATVDSVSCTLRPSALLAGEVVIDEVSIVRPVVSATRDAAGRWSFGGGLEHFPALASGRRSEPAGERPPLLRRIAIYDGVFDLADARVEGGPVTLHLRNVDAELTPPRDGEQGRLRLSLDGSEQSRLEVTATLEPGAAGESLGDTAFAAEVRGKSLGSDRALPYLLFGLPIRNAGGVFDIAGSVSGRFTGAIAGKARIDLPGGVVEGWGIRMGTPMSLAAGFDVVDRQFSMRNAHLVAETGAFAGFTGEATVADFGWADRTLNVESLEVDAYGGTWTANGRVEFEGTPSYSAEVSAADVAFRELSALLGAQSTDGGFESFAGRAAVAGSWPESRDWQRELSGTGSVKLAGGSLKSSTVMRSVFNAMFGKVPGLGELAGDENPTLLEDLTATFTLAEGSAQTSDLVFATSDYRMKGKGSVGLDGKLRLETRVALTARGIQQVYVLAAMPFRKSGDRSLPAIPVHISGTVANPSVRPDLTGISLLPFRALFDGAGDALGRLIGVGSRRADSAAGNVPETEE